MEIEKQVFHTRYLRYVNVAKVADWIIFISIGLDQLTQMVSIFSDDGCGSYRVAHLSSIARYAFLFNEFLLRGGIVKGPVQSTKRTQRTLCIGGTRRPYFESSALGLYPIDGRYLRSSVATQSLLL